MIEIKNSKNILLICGAYPARNVSIEMKKGQLLARITDMVFKCEIDTKLIWKRRSK